MEAIRINRLIDGYLDGELAVPAKRELETWLRTEPHGRAMFWQRVWFHAGIRQAYESAQGSYTPVDPQFFSELMETLDAGSEEGGLTDLTQELASRDRSTAGGTRLIDRFRRRTQDERPRHIVIPKPLFYGAIAALIAVAAVLFWPGMSPTAETAVARISDALDGRWDDGAQIAVGEELAAGTYQLRSGFAEIAYDSGARVIIEAPASFSLESDSLIVLESGNVVTLCPTRQSQGFTVRTPHASIVDLGTEFGVAVGEVTDVHVFDGRVELKPRDAAGRVILRAGEASQVDRMGAIGPASTQPSRYVRQITPEARDPLREYAQTVTARQPVAYWRMTSQRPGYVPNQMASRSVLNVVGRVRLARDSSMPAAVLAGDGDMLVCAEMPPGIRGASVYTIEAWIKPEPNHDGTVISFEGRAGELTHVSASIDVVSHEDRGGATVAVHMSQGVEADDPGVTVSSEAIYPTDRWMHIVAVKNEHELRLFVNGELVAHAIQAFTMPSDLRRIILGATSGRPPYHGRIAEVAIYGDELSERDIREHYRTVAATLPTIEP